MTAHPACAGGIEFQRQTLTIPTNAALLPMSWSFADVDGDGREDLLALDPGPNKLYIHRQTTAGFAATAQQVLDLPPQTGWYALAKLEPRSRPALLVSSATGLSCFRQSGGFFEPELRKLVQANQVFTNDQPPLLISVPGATNGANLTVPLIAPDHAVVYHLQDDSQWHPGEPLSLQLKHAGVHAVNCGWTTAAKPACKLRLVQTYRSGPTNAPAKDTDEETIEKIRSNIQKKTDRWHTVQRVDVNGDGRQDVVVWGCVGYLDTRTDLSIYLRGPDNRLPEQPTQVLRCAGFPVGAWPKRQEGPLWDLNGDGRAEVVLVRLKTAVANSSGLAEAVMSGGMDWLLSIRTLNHGAFPNKPDASLTFTTMVPPESGPAAFILLEGDFNGDGRCDLLVRRSPTQWQIILSSTNESWFNPQPGCSLELPEGELIIRDLNGDGRSDLIVQLQHEPRLVVFLSQGRREKTSAQRQQR